MNGPICAACPERSTFFSAPTPLPQPGDDSAANYPVGFLNSLGLSGLPLHDIKPKAGAVIILLRNPDPHSGLCNGTRLIITATHANLLEGVIITGKYIDLKTTIPRIALQPSDSRFPFTLRRRQFLVRVAFAMAMNKSQGQSLERAGLFLPRPVFSHGKLYVAFSRPGYPPSAAKGVRVVAVEVEGTQGNLKGPDGGVFTRNVVYREVLAA